LKESLSSKQWEENLGTGASLVTAGPEAAGGSGSQRKQSGADLQGGQAYII